MRNILMIALALGFGGCTTIGTVGIIGKSSTDTAAMIRSGRQFKELGPTEGKACKHFILGVLPIGNADIQAAVDNALAHTGGGDALINVTTSNSIYGFIPIYNIYTLTCTSVKGIAIKYVAGADQQAAAPAEKEIARKRWKSIPPGASIKIYAKTGEITIGDLVKFDGEYLWIFSVPSENNALSTSEIDRIVLN